MSGNRSGIESIAGVSPGGWGYFAAGVVLEDRTRQVVVVCRGPKEQERLAENLQTALIVRQPSESKAKDVLYFPSWEVLPHENKLPHADVISERLETLISSLTSTDPSPVVTSVQAILQKTFHPNWLRKEAKCLKVGSRLDPLDLVEWLEDCGYEPEVQVNGKGQVAMRGGIIDVFPVSMSWPVRIEFFGDEIESIRTFDPLSQLTRDVIGQVDLVPGGELGVLKKFHAEPVTDSSPRMSSLVEYYPSGTVWIFFDAHGIAEDGREFFKQVPEGDPFFLSFDQLHEHILDCGHRILELDEEESKSSLDCRTFSIQGLDSWAPLSDRTEDPQVQEVRRREFFSQLGRWVRMNYDVCLFCSNDGEARRIQEIWNELNVLPPELTHLKPHIREMSYSPGFIDHDAKVVWATDTEIFGRFKVQRPRKMRSKFAAASRSALEIDFSDLQDGDLVVHMQYGIGRYIGMALIPDRNGNSKECLAIEFAPGSTDQPNPKLYVPVTEAHLVSKYVGSGKVRPALNSMTGSRWHKAREKAEAAVEDLAAEFLRIQAVREAQGGHAFDPDTAWQREFESAFPYQETTDQLKAIEDTKRDMESGKSMDRLICGDVGYGKTEVAIRAAFKAVMNGRQVALLVPTTVLCQQHLVNFRDRMAAYPISVESLSRFQSKRRMNEIIRSLADGGVDIVIGTHRLIQKDIQFKDLGLVIIDEEQRFGVMHKERFKLLRETVDVLTLSATPIPRTLYLSLTGARDMSTIETPPQDRLPVETIIHPYDERVIRDAIRRELNRDGQVFFLHNRVGTIHTMEAKVRELVPDARVIVGHGQMSSDELEKVMLAFVNGEADVLLSTTIIESGIDIPNANTIIIDRADRFGLSQLYQLRGRVGRYKHQAYAYLLLPRHMRLVTDVRKRMSAIKQYSSLGSGFKIAMRDLEIRGAGNLLGAEQSGHITAVGFELYCQLLKQSISRLKGEEVKKRIEVTVLFDFLELNPESISSGAITKTAHGDPIANACLPYQYIEDQRHRVDIYRKLAQVCDKSELDALSAEVRDRFGVLPQPVEMLFLVAEIKLAAASHQITRIECSDGRLKITRNNQLVTLQGKFPRLTKKSALARLNEIRRLIQSF